MAAQSYYGNSMRRKSGYSSACEDEESGKGILKCHYDCGTVSTPLEEGTYEGRYNAVEDQVC